MVAATRPTIANGPSHVAWGGSFTLSTPDAANISQTVLVRPGSSTHSFDMDQRLVGMSFTAGSGTLTVTAPPNSNIAPPGYYMLFLINNQGVPSVASFVLLDGSSSAPTPTLTSVLPNSGSAGGGTGVTVTGTNFVSGATVSFGGTAATSVTVVSSTSITATTPAHAAGAVSVAVTNSDAQSGTLPNGYAYTSPVDFTITSSALSPATVAAGGSATSAITIAPVSGFNGTVTLTCSIAPVVTPAPTCALVPNSVANGSGTSTLTVSTMAATTTSLAPQPKGAFYAMWLPIGGLALLRAGFTSRKKKILGFLFGCLLFSGLIFLAACGGSSSGGGGGGHLGTPPGAYTITVTGTSGSLTHAATVSLTVH